MRSAALALLLVLAVALGLAYYWYQGTTAIKERVEENLREAQKQFSLSGEEVSISWAGIERHSFPLGKGVRILSPTIEHKSLNRVQTLTAEYLDIIPRSKTNSRILVKGPLHVTANDRYMNTAYSYQLTLNAFPSVMLRTPEEEKLLPENNRSFLGESRTTPSAVLAKLPPERFHQISVVMPSQFTLGIEFAGKKKVTQPFTLPKAATRSWQPVDYHLAAQIEQLFNIITREVHYRH